MSDLVANLRRGLHAAELMTLGGLKHDARCLAAADEIERLQRDKEELISYLKGISRQTHEMVNAHSTK